MNTTLMFTCELRNYIADKTAGSSPQILKELQINE